MIEPSMEPRYCAHVFLKGHETHVYKIASPNDARDLVRTACGKYLLPGYFIGEAERAHDISDREVWWVQVHGYGSLGVGEMLAWAKIHLTAEGCPSEWSESLRKRGPP